MGRDGVNGHGQRTITSEGEGDTSRRQVGGEEGRTVSSRKGS